MDNHISPKSHFITASVMLCWVVWGPSLYLHKWPILQKIGHISPKSHLITASAMLCCRVVLGSISTSPQLAYFAQKWTYFAEKPSYHGLCHVLLGCLRIHLYISIIGLFCIKNGHILPKSHLIAASVMFVWVDMGPIYTSPQLAYFA